MLQGRAQGHGIHARQGIRMCVLPQGMECMGSHKEATRYRALAARANYLAQDRPDVQYATKELRRGT
eukprot:4248494-Alexandrium_andersonii.AAC.1